MWSRLELKGNTVMVIAAIGVIGAVYALLGVQYVRERQVQSSLASQLRLAQGKAMRARRAAGEGLQDIEAQLAAAEATLAAVEWTFHGGMEDIPLVDTIWRYGRESGVEVIRVETGAEEAVEIGDSTYQLHRFKLQARGDFPALQAFLERVEGGIADTLALGKVAIVEEGEGTYSSQFEILLYTQAAGVTRVAGARVALEQPQSRLEDAQRWGDWEQTLSLLSLMRAEDPDQPGLGEQLYWAHISYGRQLLEWGETQAATEQFSQAQALKPGGREAKEGLEQAGTPTPTGTPMSTPTPMSTATPMATSTQAPTLTPSSTTPPTLTWTPTRTPRPTPKSAPSPTPTPIPSPTPTSTPTPTPTLTPTPSVPYRASGPTYRPNCAHTWVEGMVYGLDGAPENGVLVRVWADRWEGVLARSGEGTSPGFWAVFLDAGGAIGPREGEWYAAVVDGEGMALSPVVEFHTTATDCAPGQGGQQQVIISFQRVY